jgi:Antibiotic biosynthesis monooxygenase
MSGAAVLVVTRHTVAAEDVPEFMARARDALAAFAGQTGYRGGRVGRATDDPTLWLVATSWEGVGAYRRALGAYDVRVRATALFAGARNEPSAFEVVYADDRPDIGVGG